MPLLHRKPFSPEKPPQDLQSDEEIFVCRHTNEVFRDYELFFKRTILCSSLVWSCKFTGKASLTYQEALESERELIADGMSLPEPIQRAILTLVHHTHRGRLVNLCDEVYGYTKDRYQEGENVEFQHNGKKRKGVILRVIEPDDAILNGDAGHSKSPKTKKTSSSSEKLLSPKTKKCCEENKTPSKLTPQKSRKKSTSEHKPTTPKLKKSSNGEKLTSPKSRKHSGSSEILSSPKSTKSPIRKEKRDSLQDVIVIDDDDDDTSSTTKIKDDNVFKYPGSGSVEKDSNESLWPDAKLYHYEIKVTPIKFLKKKEGKKEKDEIIILAAAQVSRKKGVVTRDRLKLFLKATCMRSTPSTDDGYWIVQEEFRKKFDLGDLDPEIKLLLRSPPEGKKSRKRKVDGSQSDSAAHSADVPKKRRKKKMEEKEIEAIKKKKEKKDKVEELKEVKKPKLTPEERQRIMDEEREKRRKLIEEDKERRRQQREIERAHEKARKEEERIKRKVERDREREKLKEQKRMEAVLLKEWSKPREDLELDDLKPLPEPEPMITKVPLEMFGDTVMVVEFLNAFGNLFDIKDEFPSGLSFAMLEEALLEHDAEGIYYDLMQFLLGAILRTHLEEEEEEGLGGNQQLQPPSDYDDDDNQLHATVSASATMAAAWPMLHQGKQLHELIMDPFTCSELLRLHLLSSGVRIGCEDEEYRWQTRGGFTFNDDVVVEFRHKEPDIIRQLLTTCVYDMEPQIKLKILLALCGQLMTYSAARDFMEEGFDKYKKARRDWQDDQWREQRQEREEAAARYKKRQEERAKQKEEMEKRKKEKEQGKEEEEKKDETGSSSADKEEAKESEKPEGVENKPKGNRSRQRKDNIEDENKNKTENEKNLGVGDNKEGDTTETVSLSKEEEEELARVRKEEKRKKEQEYLEVLRRAAAASSLQPLGRDRLFRRYWAFHSLKGLFVEDDDPYLPLFLQSEQDDEEIEDAGSQTNVHGEKVAVGADINEGEGDVKTESAPTTTTTQQGTVDESNKTQDDASNNILVNGDACLFSKAPVAKCDAKIAKILKTNKIMLSDLPASGLSQLTSSTDRGMDSKEVYRNRKILKWGFFKTREDLDNLLCTLNPRGFRERGLREALQLSYDGLVKAIDKCPFRTDENDTKETKPKPKRGGNRAQAAVDKSLYRTMEQFLEANLRDQILDIEDRIWHGSLGAIKVSDRDMWRAKLENGIYHKAASQTTDSIVGNLSEETPENAKVNGEAEPMEVDNEEKEEKEGEVIEQKVNGEKLADTKEEVTANGDNFAPAEPTVNGVLCKTDSDADAEVEGFEKNASVKEEEPMAVSAVPSHLQLSVSQPTSPLFGSRAATPTSGTAHLLVKPVTKELAHALLKVEQGIEAKYLCPPLGEDEETKKEKQKEAAAVAMAEFNKMMKTAEKKERKEKKEKKKEKEEEPEKEKCEKEHDKEDKKEADNDDSSSSSSEEPVKQQKTVLERWEESLLACTSFSQVFVHLNTLDQSITWSKSVLNARCRLCRRKGDAEHMLLCDGCDRGHHMYCLKPPITEVPEGDWFCSDCRPKETRRSERRRKPVIVEEEEDEESGDEEENENGEEEEEESDEESDSDDDDEEEESEEEEDEESEAESQHGDTCALCFEGGELLCCETCPLAYHLSCAYPPLRRIPRGNWACQVCTGADEDRPRAQRVKKATIKAAEKRAKPKRGGRAAKVVHQSRAKKPAKKQAQGRDSQQSSRDSSADRGRRTKRRKISTSSSSRSSSPEPKKSRTAIRIRGRASVDSKSRSVSPPKEKSRSHARRDPKLNSRLVKCEKLLTELSKEEEAEYFREPVDIDKHPDYHKYVKDPIDLGTIQQNLASKAYDSVEDFATDVRRVFINCSEYFRPRAKEARAGVRLSASFETMFSDMELDSSSSRSTRSRRS